MIVLVTGPSGSGKTRFCEEQVRRHGGAAGILCPSEENDAERVRILARALPGGETRVLASRRGPDQSGETALRTPRWSFDPETVAWADAHLAGIGETDLLVVDELGPLEFERAEGFVSAFPLIDRGAFRLALVVVRPSLVGIARERWPKAQVHDVTGGSWPEFAR